jgi:hypothetical protein
MKKTLAILTILGLLLSPGTAAGGDWLGALNDFVQWFLGIGLYFIAPGFLILLGILALLGKILNPRE